MKLLEILRRRLTGRGLLAGGRADNAVRYALAVALSLLAGGILFALQGENPFHATAVMFQGGLAGLVNIGTSMRWATPCMIAGAAVVISFRSGFCNMGIAGQVYMGALAAGLAGTWTSLPHIPHVLVCLLAAGLAGGLYALIPALLRLYFGIQELIVSIMLNFVASLLTYYFVYWVLMGGALSSTGSTAIKTDNIAKTAQLTTLIKGTTVSTGFLIAIVLLLALNFAYRRTIFGYEAIQLGENMEFARVGGVDVVKRFFQIFLLSGFVAGLCGGVEVCGSYHYFLADFSDNLGWEAIMASMVAGNDPIAMIFISCIWGVMKSGSLQLERVTSLTRYTVNIIQMLFVIFVAVDYMGLFRSMRGYRAARRKESTPNREEAVIQ